MGPKLELRTQGGRMMIFSCLFPDLSLETLPVPFKENTERFDQKSPATILQQKIEKISNYSI